MIIQAAFTYSRARSPQPNRTGAPAAMTQRPLALVLLGASLLTGGVVACAPTIKLEVAPIQIYAKLDADVRVRLDRELQQLLQDNPNLF